MTEHTHTVWSVPPVIHENYQASTEEKAPPSAALIVPDHIDSPNSAKKYLTPGKWAKQPCGCSFCPAHADRGNVHADHAMLGMLALLPDPVFPPRSESDQLARILNLGLRLHKPLPFFRTHIDSACK